METKKKSRPDRWLNCGIVLTICSKRTIACRLVWKRIGVKLHERAAILHPWSNRIEIRSPSCQVTMMQQRTMSYPPVALCYLIFHPQRTTWRLNQERGPRAVSVVPSVPCIAKYKEKSVESDDSRSRPPKSSHVAQGHSTITFVHVSYLRVNFDKYQWINLKKSNLF